MNAIVCKVSDTGKTMMVGYKSNKYTIGYDFGWCANPDGLEVSADKDHPTEVPDFHPKGRVDVYDKDGDPVMHTDGTPVQRWIF